MRAVPESLAPAHATLLTRPARWLIRASLVLILFAVLWTSFTGRQATVDGLRKGCARTTLRNAVDVNDLRQDVALLRATRFTGPAVQASRLAVQAKLRVIRTLDGQIDRGSWRLLAGAEDQRAVRSSSFSCSRAYPTPPLVKLT